MTTITITGLDKALAKLKTIEQLNKHMTPPMVQSLGHLQRRLARYPKKAPGAFTAMATPRQKRAYWAKVRSGEISTMKGGGYRRSGTIGRKWSHRIRTHSGGMTGELTNNAPGVIYVQGERQQPFHKASGWPTVDSVAAKEGKAVQRYFNATIRSILDK